MYQAELHHYAMAKIYLDPTDLSNKNEVSLYQKITSPKNPSPETRTYWGTQLNFDSKLEFHS